MKGAPLVYHGFTTRLNMEREPCNQVRPARIALSAAFPRTFTAANLAGFEIVTKLYPSLMPRLATRSSRFAAWSGYLFHNIRLGHLPGPAPEAQVWRSIPLV
jgi:hypothetical protein